MEITINLDEKVEVFLKQFAAHQHCGAIDNLGTYKPLHFVQDFDPIIIHGASTPECYRTQYHSLTTDVYYDTPMELVAKETRTCHKPERFTPGLLIDEEIVETLEDYFNVYEVNAEVVGYIWRYRNVSHHFSLKEAKAYIKYQSHNLKQPRTYTVDPGYSNSGDYEPFWDLLMAIGTKLLEQEISLN